MNILISACLLGINCKYNGENNFTKELSALAKKHNFIPICPEQLGGLTTPRRPSEIKAGAGKDVLNKTAKVFNNIGDDVTKEFLKGAYETLKIAKLCNCEAAILKQRSPSCGVGTIYDGSFTGHKKNGNGVCAQLLIDNCIKVYSEENFQELL